MVFFHFRKWFKYLIYYRKYLSIKFATENGLGILFLIVNVLVSYLLERMLKYINY